MKMEIDINRLNKIFNTLSCVDCPARMDGVKCVYNDRYNYFKCEVALLRWLKGEQLK